MRESQECLFNRGKPLRSSVHGRWFKYGVNSGELAICLNVAAFPLWASLLLSFQNLEDFSFSHTVSGSVRVCICFLTGAHNILWFRCHHHVGILCFSCSVMDVQEKETPFLTGVLGGEGRGPCVPGRHFLLWPHQLFPKLPRRIHCFNS